MLEGMWAGEEDKGPAWGRGQGRGTGKISGSVATGPPILVASDYLVTLRLKAVGLFGTVWVSLPQPLLHWPGWEEGPFLHVKTLKPQTHPEKPCAS